MAYKASYRLLLCNTDNDVEKETAYFNDLRSFLPAGMIVIPTIDHKLEWNAASLPVVCIDRKPRDWKGDSVTVANEDGGYAAARHLVEMGHRTVGIVRGPAGVYTAEQRVAGFLRGMAQSKIRIPSEYIQEGRFDRESGYTCTTRAIESAAPSHRNLYRQRPVGDRSVNRHQGRETPVPSRCFDCEL
jgi:LacI family transcriptional regulator